MEAERIWPDITVVTPIMDLDGKTPIFFVASRGHHADVGGISPGSMSPNARTIEEEGCYIDCVKLVSAGRFLEDETRAVLLGAKYPVRNPDQNIADLKAQVAANAQGEAQIRALVAECGLDLVTRYMAHVQAHAEAAVKRALMKLRDGAFESTTDQGFRVKVGISVDHAAGRGACRFHGNVRTAGVELQRAGTRDPGCRAFTPSAFSVDEAIPLNAGFLRPLDIVIPEGSMLAPRYPAAVVAGNTETSQVVTQHAACCARDHVFGTRDDEQSHVRQCAGAVLRNDLFGVACRLRPRGPRLFGHTCRSRAHDEHTAYGSRDLGVALSRAARRVLDPERIRRQRAVEERRRHSPRHALPRACQLRDPFRLSQRATFGLLGGAPGDIGSNSVRRAGGEIEPLKGCDARDLQAGDAIIIETPTGGGLGTA